MAKIPFPPEEEARLTHILRRNLATARDSLAKEMDLWKAEEETELLEGNFEFSEVHKALLDELKSVKNQMKALWLRRILEDYEK